MKRRTIAARENWLKSAREVGFGFHHMYGEPYWIDDAFYAFTLEQIEKDIENPARELHEMCLDLVDEVVRNENLLSCLDIPPEYWDLISKSWREQNRHLYGRFDLAYTGRGPSKLLEYNADTPTSIFESAFFQHNWLIDQIEANRLPCDADQFNLIQESLIEAFDSFPKDVIFHFACVTDNEEDKGTATYLMDCALQTGHSVKLIDIQRIGVDTTGRFTDEQNRTIDLCFKLYPWEDLFREPFAKYLQSSIFVEPAWKVILSNKGILPLLWQRYENHPNLLPAFFDNTLPASDHGIYVRKPFFSREGENIEIKCGEKIVEATNGRYGNERSIIQTYTPLFQSHGLRAVIGAWLIGDRSCGMGIREDKTRITCNLSRFVPHVILG
ncbi:MAG TPA: putative acid--amine ligase YgiC [Hyphomicrobiaceae bacterium MAG_BT-2024]